MLKSKISKNAASLIGFVRIFQVYQPNLEFFALTSWQIIWRMYTSDSIHASDIHMSYKKTKLSKGVKNVTVENIRNVANVKY